MITQATACGKAILVGEHAVVYGQPAIAVPVSDVRAKVSVEPDEQGKGIRVHAHDLGFSFCLGDAMLPPGAEPLALTIRHALEYLGVDPRSLACDLHIRSDVPVARGMGSGTAVATALVRVLAQHVASALDAHEVSNLVYQTEILLHGTPSGIDNTVVAHEQPVFYIKGQAPETFSIGEPFALVIGDTGVRSETKTAVGMVRERHDQEPERFGALFVEIGGIAIRARDALVAGRLGELSRLMNRNQAMLQALGVSSPELETLIRAARDAGSRGAKLSGGGMGGCMVALIDPDIADQVASSLAQAGAAAVYTTMVT